MKQRCAEIQERARIARELHDTVLQAFTGATLLLDVVAKDLRRADSPDTVAAANALDDILGLTGRALADTRRAIMNLRDAPPPESNFADRLELFLHEVLDSSNVHFHVLRMGVSRQLSDDVEEHMMRICQEALSNVVRHAKARHVTTVLSYEPRFLRVSITDDGRGFNVKTHLDAGSGHFGLIGMHERATLAGGELSIRSTERYGTAIVLTVPYVASLHELFVA